MLVCDSPKVFSRRAAHKMNTSSTYRFRGPWRVKISRTKRNGRQASAVLTLSASFSSWSVGSPVLPCQLHFDQFVPSVQSSNTAKPGANSPWTPETIEQELALLLGSNSPLTGRKAAQIDLPIAIQSWYHHSGWRPKRNTALILLLNEKSLPTSTPQHHLNYPKTSFWKQKDYVLQQQDLHLHYLYLVQIEIAKKCNLILNKIPLKECQHNEQITLLHLVTVVFMLSTVSTSQVVFARQSVNYQTVF